MTGVASRNGVILILRNGKTYLTCPGYVAVVFQRHKSSSTLPKGKQTDEFLSPQAKLQTTLRQKPSIPATRHPVSKFYTDKPIYPDIDLRLRKPSKSLESTRPAVLGTVLPAAKDDGGSVPIQERAKYFFHLGKSYLSFYKTGLKNIWANYKEMQEIRRRLENRDIHKAVESGQMTRHDFQLCLRTKHDLRLLVPFSLIFLICGEFTPLIILALGSAVVPYTCRIPKQQVKDLMYQSNAFKDYVRGMENQVSSFSGNPKDRYLLWTTDRELTIRREFFMAFWLRLSPFSTFIPIIGHLYWVLFITHRLHRHMQDVLCDTILIRREGGFSNLDFYEIMYYAQNYGSTSLKYLIEKYGGLDQKIDMPNEKLRKALVPILEKEADLILNVDWKRLPPAEHFLAVYLLKNSVSTPDVLYSKELMDELKGHKP